MGQVGEAEVAFCSFGGQKNETNLPARSRDMTFSVHSDRFFNESVSPQLPFFLIIPIFALNDRHLGAGEVNGDGQNRCSDSAEKIAPAVILGGV
jgi:hypothetical protein